MAKNRWVQIDHTNVDDRGPNDLERMNANKDKTIIDLREEIKILKQKLDNDA